MESEGWRAIDAAAARGRVVLRVKCVARVSKNKAVLEARLWMFDK